jgi:hypothetical protein
MIEAGHGTQMIEAWPGSFQKSGGQKPAPGSTYSTVGYGLFEPFALWHVTGLKRLSHGSGLK